MILSVILSSITLATAPVPADTLVSADSAMSLLKKGGYTLLWRHAQTDRSQGDAPGYPNTERFQQRNLNDAGVATSKLVGAILRANGISIGDIVVSPMYRTRETAQYAFGRISSANAALISIPVIPEQRSVLLAVPAAGMNNVVVTHHFVIEQNAPGVRPGMVGEAEIAVVKSTGSELKTVAIIKMADWNRWGASVAPVQPATSAGAAPPAHGPAIPPGTPISIDDVQKNPVTAIALQYVKAFNGDSAGMKIFILHTLTPNPNRTTEQRLESWAGFRRDLGSIVVQSAESYGPFELALNAMGSTGKPVKLLFRIQSQPPHQIESLSLNYAR